MSRGTPQRPFCKAFIDAFAGTGYRLSSRGSLESSAQDDLFPDLAAADPRKLLDGSARLALGVHPRFDKYIFVEKSASRCQQLERLKEEFPSLADAIEVRLGDANVEFKESAIKTGPAIGRFFFSIPTVCRWNGRPSRQSLENAGRPYL